MLWSSLCSVGRQGGATSVEAASSCGARSASSRGPAGGENVNPAKWGSVEKYNDYRFLYEVIIVSLMRYLPRAPRARRQRRLHPPAGRGVRPRHDPCSRDDEDLRQFPETWAGPWHEAALPQRGDDRNAAHNETRSCRPPSPRTLAVIESLSAAGPILKEGELLTRAHSTMRVKELFENLRKKLIALFSDDHRAAAPSPPRRRRRASRTPRPRLRRHGGGRGSSGAQA